MSLKQKIINAKVQAAKDSGVTINLDTSNGSYIEREAQYISEAIIETLTEANFTITQLKAPVVVERLKTPDLGVNIELATLLGDKAPILDAIKKIPGGEAVVAPLESALQKAIQPLLEAGAKLPGLNLAKDSGGLESVGYVYIGDEPDSIDSFDVEDEDGQREFTTVKLSVDDASELI